MRCAVGASELLNAAPSYEKVCSAVGRFCPNAFINFCSCSIVQNQSSWMNYKANLYFVTACYLFHTHISSYICSAGASECSIEQISMVDLKSFC